MKQKFSAPEVKVAYHPDGFRIDKTASPLNRYTSWEITDGGKWRNPTPICFDSLPVEGWIKADSFDWNEYDMTKE